MNKHILRDKKAITKAGAVVLIVVMIVAATFGILMLYGDRIFPSPPPVSSPPPILGITGGYSGIIYLEVVDSVLGTGITTSTTTVDVVAAANGVFDFVSGPKDTKAQAGNPQGMNTVWAEGTELIIMPDCTGNPSTGLDYYPAMYYMKLAQGAPVYELHNIKCFKLVSTNPYTYQIDVSYATPLSQTVQQYVASNVYYWNIGKVFLYPRQAADDFDEYLTYNGVTLASVTAGGTSSNFIDTAAEITANATLASTDEHATFQMVGGNKNEGWGRHFMVVGANGKVKEYGAVIIVTTAMTGISAAKFSDEDWLPISASNLYAEKGYYKILEPNFPTKGNKAGWIVQIPIDSSAAASATKYKFSFWLNDCVNLDTIPEVGTSTSVPTAYGFVTDYGVGAVVANAALTFSSGAGATMQLMAYFTTP